MSNRTFIGLTLAALVTLAVAATAAERSWKSADGKFTIEAELVDADGTIARLKRADGRVVSVPVNKLSRADQDFIASQGKPAAQPEEADSPLPKSSGASLEEAKKVLEGKGLKVLSAGFQLPDEAKLGAALREVTLLQKAMRQAAAELAAVEAQEAQGQQAIAQLTQLNVQLNAQLANVKPNDIALNNKLVGALDANAGQIKLIEQGRAKLVEQLRTARGKSNEAREQYVEKLLELRKLADGVALKYASLAADPEARQALADLNATSGKVFQFAASRDFQTSEKRLQTLEDSVLSEKIPLRRENDGESLYVTVVINGKHTKEMLVDSGASSVALPRALASEIGIEIGSQHEEIVLVLADGSRVNGHRVTIPSLRVGKFSVENVRAAVFGPEATEAEAMLGMSFLGQFKFEINATEGTLTMVKVEDGAAKKK
jgi:aspartyl protease family protein